MNQAAQEPGEPAHDAFDQAGWACDRIRDRLEARRVGVWVLHRSAGTLSPAIVDVSASEAHRGVARRWLHTPLDRLPLLRQVIDEQTPAFVHDAARGVGLPHELVHEFGLRSVMYLPLTADRPVGVVSIEPADRGRVEELEDLLALLAVSVGQAVARREAERRREQAELLLDLADAAASSRSLMPALGEICERVARYARVERAVLFLMEDGALRPVMGRYADGRSDPEAWTRFRSAGACPPITEAVVAAGTAQVAESNHSPLLPAPWRELHGYGSALCVPVGTPPEITGVLCLDDPEPRSFSYELVRTVAAVGANIDATIARAKADDERSWHLHRMAVVSELLQEAGHAASADDAGRVVARVAVRAFAAEHAMFVRIGEDRVSELHPVGMTPGLADELRRELIGTSLQELPAWQESIEHGRPVLVESDMRPALPDRLRERVGLRSCVVLPLASRGSSGGIVHVTNCRRGWRPRKLALAEQLAMEAHLVVENALLREKERERLEELAHHATHDALTDLPNRALLKDRMTQALEQRVHGTSKVALLFIDLDRFKEVNDRLGHAAGDEVLREVAARLRRCVRSGDTVARLAGDEFVVLLPIVDSGRCVQHVVERVEASLAPPIETGDGQVGVSASVGVATASAGETDAKSLLRAADAAMYQAKAARAADDAAAS